MLLPADVLASIPSPSTNGVSIGRVRLHLYGLMIALGIGAAVVIAQRRWEALGGRSGVMSTLAVWGVPGGLIGARLYSVLTSWHQDTHGDWWRVFAIWDGGLGIWGGVIGGVGLGLYGAHRMKLPFRPLLDCVAVAFPVAQAIGRLGNYFNQELFGRPSNLPWALQISPGQRPVGHLGQATYQPTFLYEMLWDLGTFGLLLLIAHKTRLRRGYLFAIYAMAYTAGRFWIEYLRIDPAHKYGPFRLNDYTSIVVFVVAGALLVLRGRPSADGPGSEELVGDPLPADSPARAKDEPASDDADQLAGRSPS